MSSAITESAPLPTTEAEVIARLTIRPKSVKATITKDDDSDFSRHWVVLSYDITDKLKKFGNRLYEIACDIEKAGGVVTQVTTKTSLATANDRPDDKDPHGKWRCMHVEVSIKTAVASAAERAAWDGAIRDIFRSK